MKLIKQNSLFNSFTHFNNVYVLSLGINGDMSEYLFIPEDLYIAHSIRLKQLKMYVKSNVTGKYLKHLVKTKPYKNSVLHCIIGSELNIEPSLLIDFKNMVIEVLKEKYHFLLSEEDKSVYKELSKIDPELLTKLINSQDLQDLVGLTKTKTSN